jgi:hypothetical protein
MVGPAWRGTPLKFGTLTLPPEIDAGRPSLSVVEAESVFWRRFKRFFSAADPQGRVFVWKREVGTRGERRLHRHIALVTRLSNIALKRLAWRAGYGRVVNFKCATGSALSNYLAKYVAKPGFGLDAWPSRTRWEQTIIPVVPRQVPRGTPEPRGWLVDRFPRFATERAVLTCFDMRIARGSAPAPNGVAPHGEVWSPLEDDAWASRPPPKWRPLRLGRFGRTPRGLTGA